MTIQEKGNDCCRVGYESGEDANLLLRRGKSEQMSRRYWKIGITVPNVDIATAQLLQKGVQVSAPNQFLDIGYLCHLQDPVGYTIELLQHDFKGNRPEGAGDPTLPLGGGARIGQVTLRTDNIQGALDVFEQETGMKLLSIQPVKQYGFTLYFLGFTDEIPPAGGPQEVVAHREWLWKRPYTTLELQHLEKATELDDDDNDGFSGIRLRGCKPVRDECGRMTLEDRG